MASPTRLLVHTGDGKGKSSSAFGVMARGAMRGWNVGVVQFIKSDSWNTGERKLADKVGVTWMSSGDGFTWDSEDLDHTAELGRRAWEVANSMLRGGEYDLLILDELTYAVTFGWVPVESVVAGLTERSERTHVVVTGRDCPSEIIDIADTVTEMHMVKHAFEAGIPAKRGIEF